MPTSFPTQTPIDSGTLIEDLHALPAGIRFVALGMAGVQARRAASRRSGRRFTSGTFIAVALRLARLSRTSGTAAVSAATPARPAGARRAAAVCRRAQCEAAHRPRADAQPIKQVLAGQGTHQPGNDSKHRRQRWHAADALGDAHRHRCGDRLRCERAQHRHRQVEAPGQAPPHCRPPRGHQPAPHTPAPARADEPQRGAATVARPAPPRPGRAARARTARPRNKSGTACRSRSAGRPGTPPTKAPAWPRAHGPRGHRRPQR